MEQKVSQISLDKLKENNQNDIKNIYNNIESLLLEPKVIEYLRNCKLLEEKQSFDSFLNGLELGEDGTLFNKYDDKFNLSSREQEAFFGEDALLSLGIKKNIKEKVFKK